MTCKMENYSRWIEKHSVNCYFCGILVDERGCNNADNYNDNDGGSICQKCLENKCPKIGETDNENRP